VEARAELAAASGYARVRLVADAFIDDMDDEHDDDFLRYDDEEGAFLRAEQGAMISSFESLPEDADRHRVLAVRRKLAAMRWP
jgi:hypothetical protein